MTGKDMADRFQTAALALASLQGSIQSRLDDAFLELLPFPFADMPPDLRRVFSPLEDALTGGIQAHEMCDEAARWAAVLIVRTAFLFTEIRNQGAVANLVDAVREAFVEMKGEPAEPAPAVSETA